MRLIYAPSIPYRLMTMKYEVEGKLVSQVIASKEVAIRDYNSAIALAAS